MKKLVTMALALTLTMMLLTTACAEGLSIRVSTSANSGRPGLEATAPLFTQSTGIAIETDFGDLGTDTYTSTLMTQLQSGSAPDMFSAYPGTGTSSPNTGMLAEAGQVYDLTNTAYGASVKGTALENVVSVNGSVYSAVLGVQLCAIIYNTEMFEQYNLSVPQTWDEFITLIKTMREVAPDKTPLAFGGGNTSISMINTSMFVVNQPEFTGNEGTDGTFSESAAWRGGLEMIQELIQAGAFSQSASTDGSGEVVSAMVAGDAFMDIDCSSRYTAILRADPNAPIAMFNLPARNAEDTKMMLWPGTNVCVNANAKDSESTLKFFDYITGEGCPIWIEAAGGSEMPTSQLLDASTWAAHFQPLAGYADKTVMIPVVTWPSSATSNALGSGVGAMFAGVMTVDDVLASMDEAFAE